MVRDGLLKAPYLKEPMKKSNGIDATEIISYRLSREIDMQAFEELLKEAKVDKKEIKKMIDEFASETDTECNRKFIGGPYGIHINF